MRNSITRVVIFFLVLIFVRGHAFAKEISIESLLPKNLPEGWTQINGPQVFTQKTLFERINGQAELFFKYGFQKSVFTLYQNKNDPKDQVELDLYDMGNVLQAFGIFSRFRSGDRPTGVGLDSYLEETSLLFYKGRYFVMLYATEADPSILKRMAKAISAGIPDATPAPKEIHYFPKNGLKPGSIEYYPEGLLGYRVFKRGFQGVYLQKNQGKAESEDKECYLFLVILKDPKDAEDALTTYRNSVSKRGKVESTATARFGTSSLKGEDPNHGKVIVVARGFYLAGAVGFDDAGHAEALLEQFLKNIR
jgi:hypothetical protein